MKHLTNYTPIDPSAWTGRVDYPDDPDSLRWHQVVQPLDLRSAKADIPLTAKEGITNACFLGYCCDEGVRRNLGRIGTAKAPRSIRREMSNLPCPADGQRQLYDAGDIVCPDGNLEAALADLAIAVEMIVTRGLFAIVLGGGHEIALGNYRGLVRALGEPRARPSLGVVNFDAHFDLRPYDRGAHSGSSFRQIADECQTDGSLLNYFCIGIQKSANTVGLFRAAEQLGTRYVLARDIDDTSLPTVKSQLDSWLAKHEHIYLTICGDVFSSAFAPGVSAPQPFGLHPEIALRLIKHVVASGRVVAMDFAEVSPRFDDDRQTAKLAAVVVFAVLDALDGRTSA